MSISHFGYSLRKTRTINITTEIQYVVTHTADDVIDDLENKRSASLNFLFRLSALDIILLLEAKYRSHPRIMFPYS